MTDTSAVTIQYFQSRENYFWHWADNGNVIEFANGRTICYLEDLIFILNNLRVSHTPLGAVLLLLCACKDNYNSLFEFEGYLHKLGYNTEYDETEHQQAKDIINYTLNFLGIINQLPYEFRSGMKRVSLLQAILGDSPEGEPAAFHQVKKDFLSGTFDDVIFNPLPNYTFSNLQADLAPLVSASKKITNLSSLELKLRTGLSDIPQKAEITLPAPLPDDLMGELAADLKTAGLARLAKKITAALNIPMHLSGSSDQSIGGVSDISNRGHYDKLLLSELAQDDLLLTARLANNEALFLQREEMPNNTSQQWHILLDITLKMWGMPRIFALAASLAINDNMKHDRTIAWALGGKHIYPLDLSHKSGIFTALEQLDTGLSSGGQLKKIITEQASFNNKFILITSTHYKDDAQFMLNLTQVKDKLDYMVEVDRKGSISLYATRGKQHKLINKALIDLDAILFSKTSSYQQKHLLNGLPAMLSHPQYPLFYPASKIKIRNEVAYKFGSRVALITQDQRLLCWTDKDWGAMEWVDHVESGDSYWGSSAEYLYLLISNKHTDLIKIYQVDIIQHTVMVHSIADIKATTACFDKDMFHVLTLDNVISIDPRNGNIVAGIIERQQAEQMKSTAHFQVLNGIKKMINNGYSVINSIKNIYVNATGRLFIDQRELRLHPYGRQLSFETNELNAIEWIKPITQAVMDVPHLPNIKFTKFSWEDGSEAVMDSRGLLHLKSADHSLPEITIILIIEKITACWSADGKITGSIYFIGDRQKDVMLAADFYNAYIQRFINNIKTYATAT